MQPQCMRMQKKAWEQAVSDPWHGLCSIIIFLASTLAAAAGTGGGGMFVPLLVALANLSAESAVPLSQFMIFCGSIVNLSCFLGERHPEHLKRPVIDYDCLVLFEPVLTLGVTLGVLCNKMTPQWLLLLLLAMVLGLAFWRTASKAMTQWQKEKKIMQQQPHIETPRVHINELDAILELTNRKAWQVIGTVFIWSLMLLCAFHGFDVCSTQFLLFLVGEAVLLVLFTMATMHLMTRNDPIFTPLSSRAGTPTWYQQTVATISRGASPNAGAPGTRPRVEEVEPSMWVDGTDTWSMIKFPLVAFLAGYLGGLLGLGGGMIMSPVLIEVGMHAEAVQATTAVFVFLSSSLATIQFAMLGAHIWHYALWYGAITITGTMLGQYLCNEFVRKHGRYSLITMAISGVLVASLTGLMIVGTARVAEDVIMGKQLWFSTNRLCNSGGLGITTVDVLPSQAWPEDLPHHWHR